MARYEIAELLVDMDCHGRTERQARKYLTDRDGPADLVLHIDKDKIDAFAKKHDGSPIPDWEYYCLSARFASEILRFNGMLLHSSAVCLGGEAYLFTAPSGTGKSTHTALWRRCFPEAYILNDDKPVLRLAGDRFLACGTPWSGKSSLNVNACVPLKAICVLCRGQENRIERLTPAQALPLLFEQTLRGTTPDKTNTLLFLLDRLLTTVPVWRLYCLPNEEAAMLAKQTLSGER